MIDDDSSVEPKAVADRDHFDDAVLYDFAKFLTTMCLLALGGVLTLTQTADDAVTKKPVVAMVVGMIACAGICSFSAAGKIAKIGLSRREERLKPQHYLFAAVALLGMGAGGFLMMWWKSL